MSETSLTLYRITCPRQRIARAIADGAVETRAAACANIEGPMASTYRWKGVVEQAFEFILWLKAPTANFAKIEAIVKEHHPYDVPAIVALGVTQVNAPYEAWVNENTDPA
ncbi:MAG: divalent-cation tolerance protein CutA [Henriciella sp.]|nr:divalent-cation tolerance protein CutA [Henriciella sp.]